MVCSNEAATKILIPGLVQVPIGCLTAFLIQKLFQAYDEMEIKENSFLLI